MRLKIKEKDKLKEDIGYVWLEEEDGIITLCWENNPEEQGWEIVKLYPDKTFEIKEGSQFKEKKNGN